MARIEQICHRVTQKSGAQRQAAYRAKLQDKPEVSRLDVKVSTHAAGCLRRLAAHQGMSPGDVLHHLLLQAEGDLVQGMKNAVAERYYSVTDYKPRVTG